MYQEAMVAIFGKVYEKHNLSGHLPSLPSRGPDHDHLDDGARDLQRDLPIQPNVHQGQVDLPHPDDPDLVHPDRAAHHPEQLRLQRHARQEADHPRKGASGECQEQSDRLSDSKSSYST